MLIFCLWWIPSKESTTCRSFWWLTPFQVWDLQNPLGPSKGVVFNAVQSCLGMGIENRSQLRTGSIWLDPSFAFVFNDSLIDSCRYSVWKNVGPYRFSVSTTHFFNESVNTEHNRKALCSIRTITPLQERMLLSSCLMKCYWCFHSCLKLQCCRCSMLRC